MSQMPIVEQHKIVHELVERYKFETGSVYNYSKMFETCVVRITTEDYYSYTGYGTDFKIQITFGVFNFNLAQFNKSIQELQETCFQDLLNPTENELTLFELTHGFKWPLQLCCEPCGSAVNYVHPHSGQ